MCSRHGDWKPRRPRKFASRFPAPRKGLLTFVRNEAGADIRLNRCGMRDHLHHGDAFAFVRTLPDRSVDITLTDPPYDLLLDRREDFHRELRRVTKRWILVFCPPENQWLDHADQYLFWVKPMSTKNTSRRYARFVEMILVYGSGPWNAERHWSQYTNVFTDLVEGETPHPQEKPRSLVRRLILNHTNPGDLIFDPFTGSGQIPLAARALGRRFLACEQAGTAYRYAAHRLVATRRERAAPQGRFLMAAPVSDRRVCCVTRRGVTTL